MPGNKPHKTHNKCQLTDVSFIWVISFHVITRPQELHEISQHSERLNSLIFQTVIEVSLVSELLMTSKTMQPTINKKYYKKKLVTFLCLLIS